MDIYITLSATYVSMKESSHDDASVSSSVKVSNLFQSIFPALMTSRREYDVHLSGVNPPSFSIASGQFIIKLLACGHSSISLPIGIGTKVSLIFRIIFSSGHVFTSTLFKSMSPQYFAFPNELVE